MDCGQIKMPLVGANLALILLFVLFLISQSCCNINVVLFP